ncbi:hypothetical protein VTN77DRAFT_4955 [Rasamsonia byssochlamydoides]|uniref:uncharacterized protein n=1 Tax=Rasamsonia byssochlamydoides TaxID=89139 RepID=UPI003742D89F
MSQPPLYTYSVPTFIGGLNTLSHILKKAEEYAKEKGIPLAEFVDARLYEDMKPLSFQVQTVSNTAKNSLVRVAGTEPVPMEDNETTFEELQTRITRTIEVLKAADASLFAGKEDADVTFKVGQYERHYKGQAYITDFALPNFYFHLNMAYAILRNKGVPIGKVDYLTSFNEQK